MSEQVHRLFPILAVFFASMSFAEEHPKKLTEGQIAQLIEQLGSSDFDIRENANQQLREAEEALPALRRATKSPDQEARRRAKEIVVNLERRLSERFLRQAVARVNEEGLDLFIDRMVLRKDYADEAHWKAVVELARALSKHAEKVGATVPNILDQPWLNMAETNTFPTIGMMRSRVRVDGVKGNIGHIHNCLFVSSGSLEHINSLHESVLLVDGNVEGINSTSNSILICSGTIKSFNGTRNSIIFCNGDISSMNSTQNNAIFVRGELRSLNHTVNNVIEAEKFGRDNFSQGNTFLNRKERKAGNGLRRGNGPPDKYIAIDPSSLTLFQFFEPARAGLAYSMIEGDAHIDKVVEDKPFARAGLREDDRILAVDRTKFIAADVFSQLLRRRIVAGKALLRVQRGDRVMEIPVEFKR